MTPEKLQGANQYIKISCISMLYALVFQKWNKENNSIYNGIKYLEVNIIKQVQDLCNENFKRLLKEIIENLNKWKHNPFQWNRKLHIIRMAIPPNQYTFSMQSLLKFQLLFCRIRKADRKIYTEIMWPKITKFTWKKELENSHFSISKLARKLQ